MACFLFNLVQAGSGQGTRANKPSKIQPMKTSHLLQKYLILFAILSSASFTTLFGQCTFKSDIKFIEVKSGTMLIFSTVEHMNGLKFQVQKSKDGATYQTIGEISGAGQSSEENTYRYLDLSTSKTASYYRIACITPKGKMLHSSTVLVE